MKRAGKTTRPAARETETKPSSSGWRRASSAGRWNSASSSRSSTPRCARLASPGRRCGPPPTIAAVGRDSIAEAAKRLGFPLILKHNRAGKGLGVRLLLSAAALDEHLGGAQFEEPIDGITLVQRYIKAPAPFITRVEFVGGRFLYAVRVDTSQGFELCPADACQVDAAAAGVCPAEAPSERFSILPKFEHALIPRWQAFLAANDIGIAGVEFIVDEHGRAFTYDVNTNTNYNPDAEAKDGRRGMGAIADHLGRLLAHSREQRVLLTGT